MIKRKKRFITPFRVVMASLLVTALVLFGFSLLMNDTNIAVLNPQGLIAAQQRDLIVITVALSVVVVVPVFILLGVFAWKYRESNTNATYRPDEDGSRLLETLWWGIPIVIIVILSVITWITTHQLDPYKPLESNVKPLKVQVVALQWKWLFIYPEQRVASLNELRIPTHTPIEFEITADGPMSAMWIPNLGSQTYAMTGMTAQLRLQADRPGQYRGSNSNISGEGYADMNFMTIATSREAFDEWVDATEMDEKHRHLDVSSYKKLAQPSRKDPVTYYHLHEPELYTNLVNTYMHGGELQSGYHGHRGIE